jgi:hypothetical protein
MKTLIFCSLILATLFISTQNAFSNPLTKAEKEGLQLMREEEKLAHDVYQFLHEKWQLPVFSNIANAETRHFNAVGFLLETFTIEDIALNEAGKFNNNEIAFLYDSLTTRGQESLVAALEVGAFIEEFDIADLQHLIEKNTDETIHAVYQNLLRGSRNHLRAFTFQLSNQGVYYTPKILTQENFYNIVESDHERGGMNNSAFQPGNCNNQNIQGQTFRKQGNQFRNGRNKWN